MLAERHNTMDNSNIQNKYKKLDHQEHVLSRPGMYIGSIETDTYNTWVYDDVTTKIVKKEVNIVPGLYKIYDEILVNAIDHVTRMKSDLDAAPVKNIKITINKETGVITIWNDGEGIEVEKHPDHKIYIPELIFGNMLTSTNYDDTTEKTIGGQNGIGAKACNIFSRSFTIETVDSKRKRFYRQTFSENMQKKTVPEVKYCAKKSYTEISFEPDYAKFGMTNLTDDTYAMFVKRAYDVCALTDNDVNVWVNGVKVEYKNFEKYIDLYLGSKTDCARVYEKLGDRWEVVVASSNLAFEHVSFVNGICTIRGGKHVDYMATQIVSALVEVINRKKKGMDIKPQHVKNHLMLFIKSTITNPTFDSQTKDYLTTPMSKFGSRFEISDKLIDKLYKTDIVARAIAAYEATTSKVAKKTDGKKNNKIRGLVKLDDANFAGTNKSNDCVLILTEGDSAKSMAVAGLAHVGRDYYGVFPLKGKLLNVKDVSIKKLLENEEIQNIKKIIGLESGKKYTDTNSLRYGKIMIMSDQDHDGSHIRGLIMNLFQTLWPQLVHQDFLSSLLTPIIKATNKKSGGEILSFYNLVDYEKWFNSLLPQQRDYWKIKYYKGLGTSTDEEALEYFAKMRKVKYVHSGTDCDESLDLAFNKTRADDRKTWLGSYNPTAIVEYNENSNDVSYVEFINRELIHFSVYDVKRSIPSVVDGLKPSQRKVMYGCFKRNLTSEIRVAQLAAYVSENAAYHHGEASLQGTIICMAQDFVGSNNLNMLKPNGQFGSRRMGGKDASAPRYIFTQLDPIAFKIFRKDDADLLKYVDDDGELVEPEFYVPVLPVVLLNSCIGIGTGFSTSVPAYNPIDVINTMKVLVKNQGDISKVSKMTPWYRGFTGLVEPMDDSRNSFTTKGRYKVVNEKKVEIIELPVGTWTHDYKEFLEEYLEKNPTVLKDYESHYTTKKVSFVLHFQPGELKKLTSTGAFEKEFKLISRPITTSNMHLFDARGVIKKYASTEDILQDFYTVRMELYVARKHTRIDELERDIKKAGAKAMFIDEICDGTLNIMRKKKDEVTRMLGDKSYPLINGSFEYLTSLAIYNLTEEKRDQLLQDVEHLKAQLIAYQSKSIEEIWTDELDEVLAIYNKMKTTS